MTPFDLVFIVAFLTGVGTLVAAVVAGLRGRRAVAMTRLRRLAVGGAGYLAVVTLASLVTPRRYLSVGDEQCSDDWCITVTGSQPTDAVQGGLEVTFRLASTARRVAQREMGNEVVVRDGRGKEYPPVPAVTDIPLDTRLEPLQEIALSRRFSVPADARDLGVVISRGSLTFPGCCIIGGNDSFLHRRTVVRLR